VRVPVVDSSTRGCEAATSGMALAPTLHTFSQLHLSHSTESIHMGMLCRYCGWAVSRWPSSSTPGAHISDNIGSTNYKSCSINLLKRLEHMLICSSSGLRPSLETYIQVERIEGSEK
jgi:hypothetical protein